MKRFEIPSMTLIQLKTENIVYTSGCSPTHMCSNYDCDCGQSCNDFGKCNIVSACDNYGTCYSYCVVV